ncbi:unnamed protein product, partial [Ectocarpus sp. 4 AP-2014]
LPYFVRAVRLVIAYNRKYRLMYAKFVKSKHTTGVLVLTSIGLTIRAGLFFGDDPAHYSSLLLPMARAHRGGVHKWFRATVVPVEDVFTVQASEECDLLRLASGGGELAQQFGEFCRENLCMESWDFLVDVVSYERIAPSLIANHPEDEQFNRFVFILNQYLLPTSPDEINISSSMRKRVLSFGTREAFNELSLEERVGILQEPFDEILRMLGQNVLNKFRRRVALDWEAQLLTAADGDVDLVTVMKASDHRVCSSKLERCVSGYLSG